MTRLKQGSAVFAMIVAFIATWEGLRPRAYLDPVGIPTVCFGETRGVKIGDEYTVEQCKVMLGKALLDFEARMRKCLRDPDKIPDGPYVAFLSLSYNIGTGAFCRSSVARRANAGDLRGACDAITMWNRAGGRVLKGLVNRRADERRHCLEGLR